MRFFKIVFWVIFFRSLQAGVLFSAQDDLMQPLVDGIDNIELGIKSDTLSSHIEAFFNLPSGMQNYFRDSTDNYRYKDHDTFHDTLLIRAVRKDRINTVKFLTRIGTDINSRINSNGQSALSIALIWDNYQAAAFLIERNAAIQPSDAPIIQGPFLSWLIEHDTLDCIKKLDSAGIIDCNKQHSDGSTLLCLAVKYKARNSLEYLIQERHVELNHKLQELENSFTALHCAVIQNSPDIVKLLVGAGANQTIKDRRGKIAYNYALTPELKSLFNDPEIEVLKKIEKCLQGHVKTQKNFSSYSTKKFARLHPTWNKFCKRVGLDLQPLLSFVPISFRQGIENSSGKREFPTDVTWSTNLICTKNELKQKWCTQKNKINGFGHDMVNNNGDVITKKFDEHLIDEQDIARIIESYPMLAEGFDLFGLDFQYFLQKRLLDRDLHDPVFDDKNVKISTVLHSAVIEAEEKIVQKLSKKETGQHLARIVKRDLRNIEIDKTDDPIFNYIQNYEHADIMQPFVENIRQARLSIEADLK